MASVFHLLAQALGGFAIAMVFPAVVALAHGETYGARVFLLVATMVGFFSAAVYLALRGRTRPFDRVSGFVLVVGIWIVPPLVAAVPLMLIAETTYVTALFEAVSGYTTTGATAFDSLESLGTGGVFFRAELQWLGGLITLVTIVTVVAPSGLGGMTTSQVALVTSTDGRYTRLLGTLRQLLAAYVLVTVACAALLFATDIPLFDAGCLALATVSTGGFMPIVGDLSAYRSTFADIVIGIFMLIGATSIVWHRMLIEGRWAQAWRHRESYWVIGIALFASTLYAVAFALQWANDPQNSTFDAIRDGFLTGLSLVSTTGFEAHASGFTALPAPVVLLAALVGGSAISTAGGLKYYRIGGMLTLCLQELRRVVYPHSIRSARFGSIPYNLEISKSILSSLIVALVVVILATLLIALTVPSFDGAMTAAISAFANIGPLYMSGWPGSDSWPTYAEFGASAKIVMIVTMILGRFEVLVLLGALNIAYWRS